MPRLVIATVVGIAFGATSSYWLTARGPATDAPLATALEGTLGNTNESAASAASLIRGDLDIAQRARVYAVVAAADRRGLGALLDEALTLRNERTRGLSLEAILVRFAEFDPEAGLTAARLRGVAEQALIPLYLRWAEDDLDAALESVAAIGDPTDLQRAALRILGRFGSSERTTERFLAHLSRVESPTLAAEILARAAERDPHAALQHALELGDTGARDMALRRVAAAWGEQSLEAAWGEAERIGDSAARAAFLDALILRAAQTDPVALIEHLESIPDLQTRHLALARLSVGPAMSNDPVRVLEQAESLPPETAGMVRQRALFALAEADPLRALAYAESMPVSSERQRLLNLAAASFGRQDPDAALAWLATQQTGSAGLENAVYTGIASTDPGRAAELLFADNGDRLRGFGPGQRGAMSLVMALGRSAGVDRPRIADRMLESATGNAPQPYLDMFLNTWSSSDPDSATAWLVANGERIDARAMQQAAMQLAQRDIELATSTAQQLSAQAREAWIPGVARSYAQLDARAAVNWLEQFRGTSAYDPGVLAVVQGVAMQNPPVAAELMSGIAVNSNNPQLLGAASSVAAMWSRSDPTAARNWAVGLPRGPARDAALGMLLGGTDGTTLDASLLGLFSDERVRQQMLANAILRASLLDSQRARVLIEQHVTDPAERERIEELMSQQQQRGTQVGVIGFSSPAVTFRQPMVID